MFKVGELILYGNIGVCRVEAIGQPQSPSFTNTNKDYYTLAPVFGSGIIYAPLDSPVYMRPIISKEEALDLIHRIPNIQAEPFVTRDQRQLNEHYRSFFENHNCEDLVQLIRSIYAKEQNLTNAKKKVGSTDQQYMRRATDMFHGEMAAALGIPFEEIESFIEKELEK